MHRKSEAKASYSVKNIGYFTLCRVLIFVDNFKNKWRFCINIFHKIILHCTKGSNIGRNTEFIYVHVSLNSVEFRHFSSRAGLLKATIFIFYSQQIFLIWISKYISLTNVVKVCVKNFSLEEMVQIRIKK